MTNQEIWKTVEGFDGYYEVSSEGNVRSVTRAVTRGNHKITKKSRLLSPNRLTSGYLSVHLYKEGKRTVHLIHRLVAQAFIDNPENLPEINHKNEDKLDNRAINLEWCSRSYNAIYGTKIERTRVTSRKNNKLGKAIVGTPVNGGTPIYFKSISEAGRAGFTHQAISAICTGRKGKQHRGYYWRFATDKDKPLFENVVTMQKTEGNSFLVENK